MQNRTIPMQQKSRNPVFPSDSQWKWYIYILQCCHLDGI